MRGTFALFVISAVLGCGTSEDSDETQARQCKQLRDHLVELRVPASHADATAHRAAMKTALGDNFVDDCAAKLTPSEVRCALEASDPARAVDCTQRTN